MRTGRQLLASAAAIVAMLAMAAWGYGKMPPGPIVVHWSADGQPNGFADPLFGLLVLPGLAGVLSVVFRTAPVLMPPRSRIERSGAAYTAVWIATLATLVFGQAVIVLTNTGVDVDVARTSAFLIAVVLLVTGNWMGKIRYNFFFGLRTPWTLGDERVWDKTHRFAGRLMVVFAVMLLALALAAPHAWDGGPLLWTVIACALAPAGLAVVYSILISRRGPPQPTENGSRQ